MPPSTKVTHPVGARLVRQARSLVLLSHDELRKYPKSIREKMELVTDNLEAVANAIIDHDGKHAGPSLAPSTANVDDVDEIDEVEPAKVDAKVEPVKSGKKPA